MARRLLSPGQRRPLGFLSAAVLSGEERLPPRLGGEGGDDDVRGTPPAGVSDVAVSSVTSVGAGVAGSRFLRAVAAGGEVAGEHHPAMISLHYTFMTT